MPRAFREPVDRIREIPELAAVADSRDEVELLWAAAVASFDEAEPTIALQSESELVLSEELRAQVFGRPTTKRSGAPAFLVWALLVVGVVGAGIVARRVSGRHAG